MAENSTRRQPGDPAVSVVLPIYNVSPYLAACLDSLAAQQFQDFEVVAVDDGSTDDSAAIAESYREKFASFRLIRQANAGLGAARNVGVGHARGRYLAFCDSDDVVPDYAYALMHTVLGETGSDFAVGSVRRFGGGAEGVPAFLRPVHAERRLRATLDDDPEIMSNVFAVTKMFRREFWDQAGLRFPEGVRYEDQPLSTEAYLRADAFDVLVRPVYDWRVRDDGASITQQRGRIEDLRDRLATKRLTTEKVSRWGSPAVRETWRRKNLVGDLPLYFDQIDR